MSTYTLKTWHTDYTVRPDTRAGLPYALAYALATRGGYYKAQIVCEQWATVELEIYDDGMLQPLAL